MGVRALMGISPVDQIVHRGSRWLVGKKKRGGKKGKIEKIIQPAFLARRK
jgi:hypothetical protein